MKLKTIILILTMSLTCDLKSQTLYSTCIDSITDCYISILGKNYFIQLLTSFEYDMVGDIDCVEVLEIESDYSFGKIEYNSDNMILIDNFRQSRIVVKQSKDTLSIISGPIFLKDKIFVKSDFPVKWHPEDFNTPDFDIKSELAPYYAIMNDEIKNGNYTLDWGYKITINSGEFKLSLFEIPISLGRYEQKGSVVTFYNESNYPEFYALVDSDSITFKKMFPMLENNITIKKH